MKERRRVTTSFLIMLQMCVSIGFYLDASVMLA